ncbi:MAG: transposase domain-containing protein [Polyangiaceae bacterium]|nr:transposase domain-containing protein [Polyangiaceae bacterium]
MPEALKVFLTDARVPVDNNRSEGALRRVALGRNNWLFIGHDQAGQNFAGLMSLIATCVANDVNPEIYLADVLMRLGRHPRSEIEDLLPHRWAPLESEAA